ncbi:MAG: hypothetical protein DRP60_11645 [Spirochaetes bacterium]|nr:MAG: hypothetical protein DRP60_11645 [Spirochaetota bacterium]
MFLMRYVFSIMLLFLVVHFSGADPSDIESDMNLFLSFGSRADGTDGENEALNYIADKLKEMDIGFKRQLLNTEKRGHSFSQNIIAEIPGTSEGQFIVAAPIDGGAFSTALLLELAKVFKENPPKNSVSLIFLGAEEGESDFHPYGSRIASESFKRENNIFAIYLEGELLPQTWQLKIGGNGKVAPYWFVKKLTSVLFSDFIPFRLRGTDIQVARLGIQGEIGPLQSWLDSNIPTILLKGSGTVNNAEGDRQIKNLIKAFLDLDKGLEVIPKTKESIYIFLRLFPGDIPRIIPELPYVSVFLGISALLLFIILLRFRDVRLNMRRLSQYWWAWPLLFVIVFVFFFLSTLIVEETLLLADFPDIWVHAPGTFVFFKIVIAATLSLNFILITRGLPLPRSPHFYSYAAIVTSGLASLVFTAMDITITAYSLWTIINMMLFTASRNIRRKTFFLLLSIVPSFMGLLVIIREPYSTVIKSLLLSRISGSLVLTLLIFPIILAFTSLSYWRLHYDRTRYSVLTPAATFTLSLSSIITLFWILSLNPYSEKNPQPLKIIDSINLVFNERQLEISSPGPIGNAELFLDGNTYPLENLGRTADVRMPFNRTPLKVESDTRSFLGRRTITGKISGEANPGNLTIHLNSTTPFTLHEANFPFEMSPSGASAEVFVGDNPPFPLSLMFTVNNDAQLILSVVGYWTEPEDPPHIIRRDIKDSVSRTVLLEVSI